jgi:putative endonuclease
MYYIYVIQSESQNWRYVGMTNDIRRRFHEHNSGFVRATRNKMPFKLVYLEKISTRIEARNREKWLKSGYGREYIKNQIGNIPR